MQIRIPEDTSPPEGVSHGLGGLSLESDIDVDPVSLVERGVRSLLDSNITSHHCTLSLLLEGD